MSIQNERIEAARWAARRVVGFAVAVFATSAMPGIARARPQKPNACRGPDAYCEKCSAFWLANGGDWNDESEEFADVNVLCNGCYEDRRAGSCLVVILRGTVACTAEPSVPTPAPTVAPPAAEAADAPRVEWEELASLPAARADNATAAIETKVGDTIVYCGGAAIVPAKSPLYLVRAAAGGVVAGGSVSAVG